MKTDFKKYDKENPAIWKAFIELSKQTRLKGFETYGAKGILELIRWHTGAIGNDGFKVNNNFAPDYARKMMFEFPDFNGFFKLRNLQKERR